MVARDGMFDRVEVQLARNDKFFQRGFDNLAVTRKSMHGREQPHVQCPARRAVGCLAILEVEGRNVPTLSQPNTQRFKKQGLDGGSVLSLLVGEELASGFDRVGEVLANCREDLEGFRLVFFLGRRGEEETDDDRKVLGWQ